MEEKIPQSETITFLGTGGARFMIISQKLHTGGMWLDFNGTKLLVDPGPGCIVRATDLNLNPEDLSAVIISHRHLDHSADANIMVEAMTRGGFNRHGLFFAPSDAFEEEPVLHSYLKRHIDGTEVLEEGGSYQVGNVSFSTPVRHHHRTETYGMVFKTANHKFSYIADTAYFEGLSRHYADSDLAIINLVFMKPRTPSTDLLLPADHLSVPEAEVLIKELKPKTVILSHFGLSVWEAGPEKVAAGMTENTGIRVIAAQDGMKFDLAELD
jgi:ribonuclease BN (tRNA processing enzyme)